MFTLYIDGDGEYGILYLGFLGCLAGLEGLAGWDASTYDALGLLGCLAGLGGLANREASTNFFFQKIN